MGTSEGSYHTFLSAALHLVYVLICYLQQQLIFNYNYYCRDIIYLQGLKFNLIGQFSLSSLIKSLNICTEQVHMKLRDTKTCPSTR